MGCKSDTRSANLLSVLWVPSSHGSLCFWCTDVFKFPAIPFVCLLLLPVSWKFYCESQTVLSIEFHLHGGKQAAAGPASASCEIPPLRAVLPSSKRFPILCKQVHTAPFPSELCTRTVCFWGVLPGLVLPGNNRSCQASAPPRPGQPIHHGFTHHCPSVTSVSPVGRAQREE